MFQRILVLVSMCFHAGACEMRWKKNVKGLLMNWKKMETLLVDFLPKPDCKEGVDGELKKKRNQNWLCSSI